MAAPVRLTPESRQSPPLRQPLVTRVHIDIGRERPAQLSEPIDDLRAARGVLTSVLIGAALWAAILWGAWLIAR